jgi:Squalene-hopene cyclase N-terminal domain/Prenyltransferase and squalene oxidase repeat
MTAEAEQLQLRLLGAQNPDGGWAYHQGTSWTEPSSLALLALAAHRITGPARDRARSWLLQTQRPDGGWAPNPSIDTSTSTTSGAVLALSHADLKTPTPALTRGLVWILDQENSEIPTIERIAFRLLGATPPKAPGGSPWFPDTAPWIAPTVMSVLALMRAPRFASSQQLDQKRLSPAIRLAQQYILARTCNDGGWNHGGSFVRSEDAESYPEMTGMALLALQNLSSEELRKPLQRAEAFLARPQSAEALSWLQLAMIRRGRPVDTSRSSPVCRNNRDICLRLLALAAGETDIFAAPAT